MSSSDQSSGHQTHVALFPSAGMGHLVPFLRLANILLRHNCKLTLITSHPPVSSAESHLISRFLSAFPQVNELKFHILPLDPSIAHSDDPFFLQFEAIRRSVHVLNSPISALSPPLSAFVCDVTLISSGLLLATTLNIPIYALFTSSAKMLSLFAYYPFAKMSNPSTDFIRIPAIGSIPKTSLPPPLLINNSIFGKIFAQDGQRIKELNGILINAMDAIEGDTLTALNTGKVLNGLPPVIPIGPFLPRDFENPDAKSPIKWLDNLPPRSVVFASFGSRTATSRDQIKEIGSGLVSSGYRFLWVVKDKVVDKEDKEGLEEIMGEELMKKLTEKGMVLKEWVNQQEILGHRAVGGFICHCGWNSVMEAALKGVPILAWPQIGDQMINAELIAKKGLGMWVEEWGWGQKCLVKGEEVGGRIKEMMESEALRKQAAKFRDEAIKAVEVGGSCDKAIQGLIRMWSK
ncbi:UDP-glycosyltransferase 708D1-like protein [Cucumis melo var. makuwa]|uniref:Glycosyltransferase n=2 Tax=Cucumis melo TaxID=3656 RepID=A0A5A7SX64_CUCMM|nr:UDP-glycosyltransferase 708D1-like [Cucumis melo var. makuwa]TYK17678.1 UDP-glycosyltransferase 708D1-like protein [Cucumis melo var. makuwa]